MSFHAFLRAAAFSLVVTAALDPVTAEDLSRPVPQPGVTYAALLAAEKRLNLEGRPPHQAPLLPPADEDLL